MSRQDLNFVRRDSKSVILTERPDRIPPRTLSDFLRGRYKENQFEIWLLRNVYLVYIDSEAYGEHSTDATIAEPTEQDAKRRCEDIKLAQEVLRKPKEEKA